MKVSDALRDATALLSTTSDTARLDAELLMAHALGVTRSELLLRHMADAPPPGFPALVARRAEHEPVAYILGRKEFFSREFAVTHDVLIPRMDSETTVAAALEAMPSPHRVLDCGVGSGALLLTVLAERPEATGVGIDRSDEALAVAARNAERLGLRDRVRLLRRDWDEERWADDLGSFDLILANPPYVEDDAPIAAAVRRWEPGGAAVLEIGATQAEAVSAIAVAAGSSSELHRDLGGRPRALVLRPRSSSAQRGSDK